MSQKKSRKALKIILDSSFLFIPSQFKIDIFEELATVLNRRFEPVILSPTYKELQKIAESGSTKLRRQATLALKFAQKCRKIDAEKGVKESHDDVIVRVAAESECCAATNDRALRKRLRSINVPVVYLRQKSHLAVDGAI
ncbi:MAG: 30S processome protein Utp24 [Candidatus Bathyarchaeota archaeon]|nr:30S processome protein Utp24 [Candidatus Bathyarchaeota archaeon]